MIRKMIFVLIVLACLTASCTAPAEQPAAFSITFDPNGGTGAMEPLYAREGESVSLPPCGFVRAGYRFTCWSTVPDAGKIAAVGEAVVGEHVVGSVYESESEITVGEDLQLYAQWMLASMTPDTADFVLPASIRRIGSGAFEGAGIAAVYIPDGCTEIAAGAFRDCRALAMIRIPATVQHIDDTAFDGCIRLEAIFGSGAEAERIAKKYLVRFEDESQADSPA